MKYFKRSQTYQTSNVLFDPKTCRAYSYGWWRFVDRINGHVVFNSYRYSKSTSGHQRKVLQLMRDLGIKIDLFVYTACDLTGRRRWQLQSSNAGLEALRDAYRKQDFERAEKIKQVFKVKMSQKEIQALYVELEEQLCEEFLKRSLRRQEKKERYEFLAKAKKLKEYLKNKINIRNYDIVHRNAFGDPENAYATKVAVHQVVDLESLEKDVNNALHKFHRDGFGSVVFYV